MQECELLANCGFHKKYAQSKELAVKGFVALYCKGYKQNDCARKKYRQEHGTPPSEDMMPDGHMMKG